MNNRTIYIMVIALMFGVMSATLAHRLVTAGKEEVLVPTRDLAPRMALKDPELFEKRYMSKEELPRGTPVLDHAEIKHRFSKNLILRKDEPIYLDDTTEDPAEDRPAPGTVNAPLDLPPKPLLPAGTMGVTLRADESLSDQAKVGDPYELVLTQVVDKDGEQQLVKVPLLRATVAVVHRHRGPGDSAGKVNALTFVVRIAEAQRITEALKQGQVLAVPVPGPAPAATPPGQP